MLYLDPYYGDAFAGTDENGAEWGQVYNMNSYQNNPETVTLYWTFYPYGAMIHQATWEIQVDSIGTFDSSDLVTYQSHVAGVPSEIFIPGIIHKGVAVPILPRLQSEDRPMYWRVRGTVGDAVSQWQSGVFMVPAAIDVAARSVMLAASPDVLYSKSPDTNLYKLLDAFAQEMELSNQYLTMTTNDAYINSVRDQSIVSVFGELVDIYKKYEMQMIDYREIVKSFMYNIRKSPSTLSVSEFTKSVFVNYPDFTPVKDIYSMYVGSNSISDPVYVAPSNTQDTGVDGITVWDARHIAYGVIVDVLNGMTAEDNDVVSNDYVLGIIRKLSPSYAPVFLRYK